MNITYPQFVNYQVPILVEYGEIILQAIPNDSGEPYDLSITAFGKQHLFAKFISLKVSPDEGNTSHFAPDLPCITMSGEYPGMVLVGVFYVIFINVNKEHINVILKLNRKSTDDQGFYSLNVHLLNHMFLLLYEGGAACISSNGEIIWHNSLFWDDIYLGMKNGVLVYSSEYGEFAPSNWGISILDGTRRKVI
jgi:hypothetical protein